MELAIALYPVILEYSTSNGTLFFGNNIKSKMGILDLIRKLYFNQKALTKNIFEVCIRFHKCWDRMEFLHS